MSKHRDAAMQRLIEAAADSVAANQVWPVDKNGKHRVSLQKIDADGRMAMALSELGIELPKPLPEKTTQDLVAVMQHIQARKAARER